MEDANVESNLVQVAINNRQPNLWRQELFPITLVQGTATYNLPSRFIAVRDAYISTTTNGVTIDRPTWALGTVDYDYQSNKTIQAPPQSYFVNKQISPTVTLWPVPDGNAAYILNMRIMTQTQDVSIPSGVTLDMPYRFLDVFVAGLAHRLARIYKPELEVQRKQDYLDAWVDAATTDTEDAVSINISPTFGNYWWG